MKIPRNSPKFLRAWKNLEFLFKWDLTRFGINWKKFEFEFLDCMLGI
jgi:hypothetical protein